MIDWLMAAATIAKAGGELYKGFASSEAHQLSAGIARDNIAISRASADTEAMKADYAAQKGGFESSRLIESVRRIIGGQSAHFAKAGFDATTGSPLLLAGITAAQGEIDAGLIRAEAAFGKADALARRTGHLGRAATAAYTEVSENQKATNALVSGYLGAGTAMLSGLDKWAKLASPAASGSTMTFDPSVDFDPWAGLREAS